MQICNAQKVVYFELVTFIVIVFAAFMLVSNPVLVYMWHAPPQV